MRELYRKESFLGFTYAGIHSSQFGLLCTSSSGRYQKALSPEWEPLTQKVSGSDGTLYFGQTAKQRTIPFKCVFDNLTEQDYVDMIKWLNSGISPIILDETPYIQYFGKINGQPQIKFVPFDGEELARIYKGEIDINFICYDPYGYSVSKWISDYTNSGRESILFSSNQPEWIGECGLQYGPEVNGIKIDQFEEGIINLYNGGNLPVDFVLKVVADGAFDFEYVHQDIIHKISIDMDLVNRIVSPLPDSVYEFDTKKHLVKLYTDDKVYIVNNGMIGSFFKIDTSINKYDLSKITFNGVKDATIEYSYKYL